MAQPLNIKKVIQRFRPIFFAAFWFIAGIAFVFFISASDHAQKTIECHDAIVHIDHEQGNYFVDEKDIKALIAQQLPGNDFGITVGEINTQRLERFLEATPYIDQAEIYFDANGNMKVDIAQRYPLLRIINKNNQSYYLSADGEKMPIAHQFSSRVPIVSGYVEDNEQVEGADSSKMVQDLYTLAQFLNEHPFWKAQIEQVYVEENGDWILSPKVGNHQIIFGTIDRMEAKFTKLLKFYQEGLAHVGWNQYQTINVKYKDQIVCK